MDKLFIAQKCIFRGDRSGVFFGTLKERKGKEVLIENCQRIYYWSGACSISEIALSGVFNKNDCKFTVIVDNLILTDCIEILLCTKKAIKNLESVVVWKIN